MKKLAGIIVILLLSLSFFGVNLLIVRGDGEYPPHEFTQKGQLTGLHIDIVNAVAKQLGWNITIKSYPWARAVDMIKNSEADAILFLGKNPEREEFTYYFNNVLSEMYYGFFTLSESVKKINYKGDIKILADKKYLIGTVPDYSYPDKFVQAKLNTDSSKNDENLIEKLLNKRNDLFIANVETTQYILKVKNLSTKIVLLNPAFERTPNYIGFSKMNDKSDSEKKLAEQNAKAFSDALEKFKKTKDYQNILKKYK